MADKRALTLRERNDETLSITITGCDPAEDLAAVTVVEVILKADTCNADTDGLVLTSANPAQVSIVSRTANQINVLAYVPASALIEPYNRVWRVDGIGPGGARRTAMYGPVTVVNL
jgi:hypothetical protein